MELSKIPRQVLDAVRQRERYTDAEIESLSPQTLFDEYCTWNGLINWGDTLWSAMTKLQQAAQPSLTPFPQTLSAGELSALQGFASSAQGKSQVPAGQVSEVSKSALPKVVVWLENGVVQGAVADQKVDVAVIEYDDLADKDERFLVPQPDGSDAEAVGGLHDAEIDQARVAELFQAIDERRPVAGMKP